MVWKLRSSKYDNVLSLSEEVRCLREELLMLVVVLAVFLLGSDSILCLSRRLVPPRLLVIVTSC